MESNVAELALQDRLMAWFETNKKQVLWGAIGMATVGMVAGFVVAHRNTRELDANEELSKATSRERIAAEQIELTREKSPAAFVQASSKAADDYLKVAESYPGTAAGARAQLLGAASLYAGTKYPEAKTQFDKYLQSYRDTAFASQAALGAAACLNALGKTDEAVTAYNEVAKRYPGDNVASQARLALARLYEKQNKFAQAKDIYEDLFRTFGSNASLGSEAGTHLQELFVTHPELFPANAPSTNAPVLKPAQP